MDKIAKIISEIFSPLLIPTYAMALTLNYSILFMVATNSKLGVIAMTFVITGLVPLLAILLLYASKRITDPGLNNRSERFIPYIITLAAYIGFAVYLSGIHAPVWLTAFPCGAAAAVVISIIVTIKWKISAHGAAAGGLVALLFCLIYYQLSITPAMIYILYGAIAAAGLVGTSRVILNRHTVAQVVAGTINGFVCVAAAIWMFH